MAAIYCVITSIWYRSSFKRVQFSKYISNTFALSSQYFSELDSPMLSIIKTLIHEILQLNELKDGIPYILVAINVINIASHSIYLVHVALLTNNKNAINKYCGCMDWFIYHSTNTNCYKINNVAEDTCLEILKYINVGDGKILFIKDNDQLSYDYYKNEKSISPKTEKKSNWMMSNYGCDNIYSHSWSSHPNYYEPNRYVISVILAHICM